MPPVRALVLTLILLPGMAAADDKPACRLRGQVTDVHGSAVEGARVKVSDSGALRGAAVTDRTGHYAIEVPPGDYDVAFEYGRSHQVNQVSVTQTCTATLDGRVDITGEVIVIQDQKPPSVPARPLNFSPRKAPPYSDAALEHDAWTRAWMLLDVSATGEVTQFKFLKRPGYDLESIAASEVFKLKFEPARDDRGRPLRIWLVWGIEWPSAGWLLLMGIPRTAMPPTVGLPPRPLSANVPCRGSGPMMVGSFHPGYRDCSVADLSRADEEPWIPRS